MLDFIGETYFDVDGLGSSYIEVNSLGGGALVGDSVTGVGVGENVCSVGSEEYVGVFGRKRLVSSSRWSSKSSRNSKCTSERLSIGECGIAVINSCGSFVCVLRNWRGRWS